MIDDTIQSNGWDEGASSTQFSFLSLIIILIIFIVLIGAAIRLTRVSVASAVESFHTYVDSKEDEWGVIKPCCSLQSCWGKWRSFWMKVPRSIWNFYIDAFIVPSYRKEWGKYQIWSCTAEMRLPKPELIKREIRRRKRLKKLREKKAGDGPKPIPHNHGVCTRVIMNIAGLRYETQLKTLQRFPDTVLGNDAKRLQYYDPVTQEYYFDRNRSAFEAILYYYQSGGRLRRPENVPADVLLEDALFFQLSQGVIEKYRVDEGLAQSVNRDEIVPQGLIRRKIWLLFDFPESSMQAEIVAVLSIIALFLSIAMFCIETLDDLELKPVLRLDSNGTIKIEKFDPFDFLDPFFFTESVCVSWFVLEFLMRLLCSPILSRFVKSPLNMIDAIALIPYFISIAPMLNGTFEKDDSNVNATDSLYILRIVRIVRVFRIFKLSRHSKGLKILGKTLKASMNELFLLIFFIILGVVFFSSTMYFAEMEIENSQFHSIPDGFWWSLITITTVGFGDVVPRSVWGKIVGTFCAIAGVLTIALPVPVIVANFNYFYKQAVDEHDFRWININHVASCPYRPHGSAPVHSKNNHMHHDRSEHADILQNYSDTDLKKYDRRQKVSQLHIHQTFQDYAKKAKKQGKRENSSDVEFSAIKKGTKAP